MTIVNKREQIWQSLSDYDYRHQFVKEEINVGIAFQIRSLRNRQNLTQGNLASLMGVKQPLVSAWENPNYGKYTLGTLEDLAKAFDVGLFVRFVPFGSLVNWTADLKPDDIAPSNFSEEQSRKAFITDLEHVIADANQTTPSVEAKPSVNANMAESKLERIPQYA